MTIEDFNNLPADVRKIVESKAGCLGCGGNTVAKLTKAYELYKSEKKMKTYILFGGGINYAEGEERGVLVAIKDQDSDFEVLEKIRIAKLIHKKNPEVFSKFDAKEISILEKELKKSQKVIKLTEEEEIETAPEEEI